MRGVAAAAAAALTQRGESVLLGARPRMGSAGKAPSGWRWRKRKVSRPRSRPFFPALNRAARDLRGRGRGPSSRLSTAQRATSARGRPRSSCVNTC